MKKYITILIFLVGITTSLFAQKEGQASIDSMLEVIDQQTKSKTKWEDTNKVSLLIELTYEYHKADPDIGITYGKQALALSEKLHWKKGEASAYNRLGLCYWAKADYPQALESHFKALAIFEDIGYKKGIATVLGNIGLVYDGQQDYDKALSYHFKSLKLNNELVDNSGIARNLGNIGMAYDANADYDHSIEYYLKALKIYENLGDKNGVARNLGNIGFVYTEQFNHLKALEYHYKALAMNEALGNKILTGLNLGNIGEEYYNIAIDTSESWSKIRPDSLNKLISIRRGENYLNRAITIFKEIDDLNSLQELYRYLSDLYILEGNHTKGFESYKLFIASRDSVFSLENNNKIKHLEAVREEALRQKQIELLKSQNEVERLITEHRKALNYSIAGAFVVLSVVAFTFFRQSKKRAVMNTNLQKAYSDLKNTQAQLLQQEQLASLGKFSSNMAHEIQNPLNFVNNFSEVSGILLTELSEISSSDEQHEIIGLLKQNVSKIYHHGKHAEGIVRQLQDKIRAGAGIEAIEKVS